MSQIRKVWTRHNNGDYTWQGYEIRTVGVRKTWGALSTYWAYSPDGVCLYAAAEFLADAKKACHQHYQQNEA